jgi:hypothetical protein
MKKQITITQVKTTVRTVFIEQESDTDEDLARYIARGINNLGFDNVGEFKSEDVNDFIDDINVDSLD